MRNYRHISTIDFPTAQSLLERCQDTILWYFKFTFVQWVKVINITFQWLTDEDVRYAGVCKKNLAQHVFLDYTCFFFSFVPALHHHLPPQLRRGCFFVSAVLVPCAPLLFPEWFFWSRLLVHGLSVSDASERQTESASKSFCDRAAFPLFLPVPVQQRGGALAFSPRQQTMPSVFFVAAQRQHNCPPLHLLRNKKAYTQVHNHWNSRQTPQIFPQFKESKKRLSVLIQRFENKVLHWPEPSG